ncbi:MAG: MGMT family protein [Nanobdellota archaeon]
MTVIDHPFAPAVACHRIIASDRTFGGFATGSRKKKELLKKEKVSFDSTGRVNKEHTLSEL